MIKQYRKKPVVIKAIQLDSTNERKVVEWIGKNGGSAEYDYNTKLFKVKTLEGEMIANENDYIIQGVQGEFYPCKPSIFEATYEEV
jgi:hypothetical protein